MKAIFKKELWGYFGSVGAYVVAILFLVLSSLFLWFLDTDYNLFNIGNANIKSFFQVAPWIWLFLIPALSMRTFAEEYNNGTLEWLFSKPIKISSIIWAKYWALVIVILFSLFPTFIYIYSIGKLSIPEGNVDYGVIFSGYLGLMLLGMSYLAIGLFCSALTKNVVYSYLLALFISFVFYFGLEKIASFDSFGSLDFLIKKLGFTDHYTPFISGLIDSRDVFYFLTLIGVFLWANYYTLKKLK